MPRRIIGQCNTSGFKDLEHLATLASMGENVYQENMSGRQKAAVLVVHHFQACGVDFLTLYKVREVLVWEMPDKGLAFEYKLLDTHYTQTMELLREMKPRQLSIPSAMRQTRRQASYGRG